MIKRVEEEGVIVSYYDPYIPEFTNNGKEYKSLNKLFEEEIKEKDIVIITTAYTKVDCEIVAENAKAIFDIINAIKFSNKNLERL